ncbi:MAG: hypothetical protein RQ824_08595 [bacterium]|nr:hypothetical protein [bacterium]
MNDFFDSLDMDVKKEMSAIYNEMIELKEHRRLLLEQYRLDRVEDLKEKIDSGEIGEHPAYDHYLAILSLNKELEPMREKCAAIMEKV